MATRVYGTYETLFSGTSNKIRPWLDYTITTNSNDTYTLTLAAGIQIDKTISSDTSSYDTCVNLKSTGKSLISKYKNLNLYKAQTTTIISSFTQTWSKTHSAQSINVVAAWMGNHTSGAGVDPSNATGRAVKSFTITARPSYKVTFNNNGGSGGPGSQTKWYNEALVISSTKPTRTGYSFWHWNTTSTNSGTTYNINANYNTNSALTIYAIWNPIIYYNANGGSGAPSQATKTYGTNYTVSSTVPTRPGYEFIGWNTKADGTGTSYSKGSTYSSNTTATLYAQWISITKEPTISSMKAIRWSGTASEGEQDDEGTSAKIEADWSIDLTSEKYGDTNTATATLTITPQSGSSSGITVTSISGTSGTSGTAVFMANGLSIGMQYTAKFTVTDSAGSIGSKSVIITRSFFMMDFKAGGQAIGIGRAAPSSGLEIGYNTTFDNEISHYKYITHRTSIDSNASTQDSDTWSIVRSLDINDIRYSMLAACARVNGSNTIGLYTYKTVGGTIKTNALYLGVDSSGNYSYYLTSPSAFRTTLQLPDLIQRGNIAGQTISSKAYKDYSVTFSPEFSTTPTIIATLNSSSTSADIGSMSVGVVSVSTTGATLRVFNDSSSSRAPGIYWMATNL